MTIKVGENLKNFTLEDQNENKVSLNDFKGKKVLLSFHPLAWTGVCTKQMKALDDNYEQFEESNTIPLGINVEATPSKKAWAEDMELENLRILSDFWPHGQLAKELGVFIEENGFSGRVNILLDEEHNVVWVKEYDIPELPDIEEVLEKTAE
ncbi:redoxin domain-containing protein [Natronospora cellulosivora (SeqCode)]